MKDFVWECNECGSQEYTSNVSESDLGRWLSCGNCGCDEFHKECIKQEFRPTKDHVDDAIQSILQHVDFAPLIPYKEYLEQLRDGYIAAGDSVKEIKASSSRSELEYIQDRWQTASRIQWLIDRIDGYEIKENERLIISIDGRDALEENIWWIDEEGEWKQFDEAEGKLK